MKKSIVLLISLLFISALSILLLKNLEDTSSFIKEQNDKLNKIQMIVLVNNMQSEISEIFSKNQNSIEEFLSENNQITIPLNIKDSELIFTLKQYSKVDINLLAKERKNYKSIEELFNNYDIHSFDTFKSIYLNEKDKYKSKNNIFINNNKQLDDIINKFIKQTYSNKILEIKNELGFIGISSDKSLYELGVKIKHLDTFSKAYYILDKKGKVIYFESSFK